MWNHEPAVLGEGTRIRLTAMPDDPDPIPLGSEGTITGGSSGQVWVDWDNGRTLMLLTGIDHFEVIT